MNDPFGLILLFAGIVAVWVAASAVVVVFLAGARRGREEYDERARRHIELTRSYRDREAERGHVPVRVREDDRPLRLLE